jgi:hypothetical protein
METLTSVEILVYVGERAMPHRHLAEPDTTFEAVVTKLRDDSVIEADMVIVEEDGEDEIALTELIGEGGRSQRILHCHHCRHIQVTIEHPGTEPPDPLEHAFRPGVRVGRVKDWALRHIPNIDKAAKWCLRDGNGEILDNQLHIGTLAPYPGCSLAVTLTEHHKPKG